MKKRYNAVVWAMCAMLAGQTAMPVHAEEFSEAIPIADEEDEEITGVELVMEDNMDDEDMLEEYDLTDDLLELGSDEMTDLVFEDESEWGLIDTIELDEAQEQGCYVLMNIPYNTFYQTVNASLAVDAVSGATSKVNNAALAGGSYSNSENIPQGVRYVVYVEDLAQLSTYTQVMASDSVEVSYSGRGQTTTAILSGADTLMKQEDYAYFILAEEEQPVSYLILNGVADGVPSFTSHIQMIDSTAEVTISYGAHWGDYQFKLAGDDALAAATIYGASVQTDNESLALPHLSCTWRQGEAAVKLALYPQMNGAHVNSLTYYTSAGVFNVKVDQTLPAVYYAGGKMITSVSVDGTAAESAEDVINSDGSVNMDSTLFANGAKDAYLLTTTYYSNNKETKATVLVGDASLEAWEGSWENWQKYIYPDAQQAAAYPLLGQVWDQAYEGYIAAFEKAGMGEMIRKNYPDTDALKAYWNELCATTAEGNTVPVADMEISGNTITWKAADGSILAEDTYKMTGKVRKGLENAVMYVFTADNLTEESAFRYLVAMKPGMEGTQEQPIAGHYHFQYGKDLASLLVNDQLYDGADQNIANGKWYATMIDANAGKAAKYNVILGMHRAEKWTTAQEQAYAQEEASKKAAALTIGKVSVSDQVTYTGKELKPAVTVLAKNGSQLPSDVYTVTYSDNMQIGTAKVTVEGVGQYTGSETASFRIVPKKVSIKKLKKGKKSFTLTWKKGQSGITGYHIQYSLKKDFASAKTVTVRKRATTAKTVKKLKAKKTYYVRIRAYKVVDGVQYASEWSSAKKVKTTR